MRRSPTSRARRRRRRSRPGSRRRAAATRRAASPRASSAAVTSRSTATSTSSATSMASPLRSRTSSTTRTARIALLHYADGEKRYILAPDGLAVGTTIMAGPEADILVGNALPLSKIPLGTTIHNIELKEGKGGQMVRSAGAAAQLMAREGDWATLRLPSGEMRKVHVRCYATIGQVGNLEHLAAGEA